MEEDVYDAYSRVNDKLVIFNSCNCGGTVRRGGTATKASGKLLLRL